MGAKILKKSEVKTLALFINVVYFIRTIQSDKRLQYIKLRVRIRDRSADYWKCLSRWVPFLNHGITK